MNNYICVVDYSKTYNDIDFIIVIMHPNGEYSRYDHLSYNSSRVRVGQLVRAGEEIARVGMTGFTYISHLHFQVFVVTGINASTDFDTLEITDFDVS
jgi:murein DD-endopeptidase MepM/ murein hydrolase activator NlpD